MTFFCQNDWQLKIPKELKNSHPAWSLSIATSTSVSNSVGSHVPRAERLSMTRPEQLAVENTYARSTPSHQYFLHTVHMYCTIMYLSRSTCKLHAARARFNSDDVLYACSVLHLPRFSSYKMAVRTDTCTSFCLDSPWSLTLMLLSWVLSIIPSTTVWRPCVLMHEVQHLPTYYN